MTMAVQLQRHLLAECYTPAKRECYIGSHHILRQADGSHALVFLLTDKGGGYSKECGHIKEHSLRPINFLL